MALIKCAECGKEISNKAASCPHCGAPNMQPTLEPKQETKEAKDQAVLAKLRAEEEKLEAKAKNSKKKSGGAGCALVILIILAIWIFGPCGNEDKKQVVEDKSVTAQEKKLEPLGYTPTQFMKALNKFSTSVGQPPVIKDIKPGEWKENRVNDGYIAVMNSAFSNMGIIAFAPRGTKDLTSITLIAGGDLGDQAGSFIVVMADLINVFTPQVSVDDMLPTLNRIMYENGRDGKFSEGKSTLIGDIKYFFSATEMAGIHFSIEKE